MKLRLCFPIHFSGRRISYTCNHLSQTMQGNGLEIEVIAPSCDPHLQNQTLRPVFSSLVGRALGKVSKSAVLAATEWSFLNRLDEGDPVYLWSMWTKTLLEKLGARNGLVFVEKFNGLAGVARELLDIAYDNAGLSPTHGINDEAIARDDERVASADFVFVANPISADNFVRRGVSSEKIIRSSYGWDPARLRVPQKFVRRSDRLTFVFVAVAEVRKGTNLLLQAWEKADLDAKLIIAGPVSEEIRHLCADILNREDVETLGWVEDLADIYHSADVFVFPTHDEGGPLVTYEAMGCGVPVIVSPMGAGAIARDGLDGLVIDPYATDEWVTALRRMAHDAELRVEMGNTSRIRAQDYTWDKVGARRREAVLERTL